jgi:hypothetical protein
MKPLKKWRCFDTPYTGCLYTRSSSSDNTWRGSRVDEDRLKIWLLRNNTKIQHFLITTQYFAVTLARHNKHSADGISRQARSVVTWRNCEPKWRAGKWITVPNYVSSLTWLHFLVNVEFNSVSITNPMKQSSPCLPLQPNTVITSWKGTEYFVSLYPSVVITGFDCNCFVNIQVSCLLWSLKIHYLFHNSSSTDICAILEYYAAFDFLTLEDGTDRLSRNVGTELPPNAA